METKTCRKKSFVVYYGYRRNIKARFLIKSFCTLKAAVRRAKKLTNSTHSVYTILNLETGIKTIVGTDRNPFMNGKKVKWSVPVVAVPVRRFVTEAYLAKGNFKRIV